MLEAMRALSAAMRVPVMVAAPGENRGDGPTAGGSRRVLANVKGVRQVRQSSTGGTVVDPYVLEVAHGEAVPVGSTITLPDGEEAVVESSELVYGPFGVPHHREVRAL